MLFLLAVANFASAAFVITKPPARWRTEGNSGPCGFGLKMVLESAGLDPSKFPDRPEWTPPQEFPSFGNPDHRASPRVALSDFGMYLLVIKRISVIIISNVHFLKYLQVSSPS
jgi:hypothetical protein